MNIEEMKHHENMVDVGVILQEIIEATVEDWPYGNIMIEEEVIQ